MREFFKGLWAMLQSAFALKRPEEVRKQAFEDKRPGKQQQRKYGMFKRAWRFVKRQDKRERKAKKKGLDDELEEQIKEHIKP